MDVVGGLPKRLGAGEADFAGCIRSESEGRTSRKVLIATEV